jgi:hypothetical protein
MAIKDTMKTMRSMLEHLLKDLTKVERGNKAAAQRVRTGSIKFAKKAKIFRKESVAAEKKGAFKKPVSKKKTTKRKPAKKKVAKKKPAKKSKTTKRKKRR